MVVCVAIILLAFYTTRFVAMKAGSMMKGKHIRIIDVVSLGVDKKLYLIKAGDKYLLLSASGKSVGLISEVSICDAGPENDKGGFGKELKFNLDRLKRLVNKNYEAGGKGQNEDKEGL